MKKICIASVVLLFLLATAAWPQASSSTVRGAVRDQSQAVIPSVTVTLTNTETNAERTTQTNPVGLFVFPGVTPGPYRIAMAAAGFQKFEATVTVQVQQDVTVDGVLTLGQTTTQVEVKDITPMVRVDSPSLGHDLERQRIEQLPLNGRSYTAFMATVPGMMTTAGGRLSSYGLGIGSYTLTFDGSQMNDVWEGWDYGRTPGLDSVEELRVEVNNSSAKYTRPTTIILSSKGGTNQFHGALFETNRNSGYGVARQRQDNWAGGKPPYLNRNEFGASAGGPVYIPKLYNGQNKTFWFFAYEATRTVPNTTYQYNVPTEAMRNGDFRGLVDSSGRQYQLYDPMTTDPTTWARKPLTYNNVANVIDPARISPTAKYLLGITPKATDASVNPLIDINWNGVQARPVRNFTTNQRIDHRISDKDLLWGRFSLGKYFEEYTYAGQIMLNHVSGLVNRTYTTGTSSLNWVRVVSPTVTNELLASGSWDDQWRGTGDGKTDFAALQGVPNPLGAKNWPALTGMGLGNYAYGQDGPFYEQSKFIAVQDNATKIKGRHELQFGFHFKNEILNISNVPWAGDNNVSTNATSLYDPSSTPTSPQPLAYTGHGMANFYLGVFNYQTYFKRPWWQFGRQEYAPYFQDNFKVTSRLTLNMGLRYERRTPMYDKNNSLISFSLDKRAYVVSADSVDSYIKSGATLPSIVTAIQKYGGKIISYKDAGMPQRLVDNNWTNFGPRLGLAYRAFDGKKSFVIRSGYRLSSYTFPVSVYFDNAGFSVPNYAAYQYSLTDSVLSPDGLPNIGLRTVPKYIAGVNSGANVIDTTDIRSLGRGFDAPYYMNQHSPDPLVHDWNFTIEKEVMANTVARVAYIGNYAYNTQQVVRENQATPSYIWIATTKTAVPTGDNALAVQAWDQGAYGEVRDYAPMGYSRFNGMQAEIERRYSKGFGFQLFYLVSNALAATNTDNIQGANYYLPGAVPTDTVARNRFLNYKRDILPNKQRVNWNFIYDLPMGRGKKLGSDMNKVADKIVGGWQLAGQGSVRTSYWTLPTNYWQTDQKIQVYGYKYPIQNCTSGTCYPAYLWWNGYIPSNLINSHDANGKPNGYEGIPSNYKPAATPFITYGQTTLPANAPTSTNLKSYWDTNTVWIPLSNGAIQRTTYNDNMNPWRNQFAPGPRQWFQDASLFKFVKFTEKVTMRFNIDFFNVFNNPNNPTSIAATGVMAVRNSGSSARVTQLTARLMW